MEKSTESASFSSMATSTAHSKLGHLRALSAGASPGASAKGFERLNGDLVNALRPRRIWWNTWFSSSRGRAGGCRRRGCTLWALEVVVEVPLVSYHLDETYGLQVPLSFKKGTRKSLSNAASCVRPHMCSKEACRYITCRCLFDLSPAALFKNV